MRVSNKMKDINIDHPFLEEETLAGIAIMKFCRKCCTLNDVFGPKYCPKEECPLHHFRFVGASGWKLLFRYNRIKK